MSTDTDLKPALEYVARLNRARAKPRAEVAAWSGENMRNRRLSISGGKLWCSWLSVDAYEAVRDKTNYA